MTEALEQIINWRNDNSIPIAPPPCPILGALTSLRLPIYLPTYLPTKVLKQEHFKMKLNYDGGLAVVGVMIMMLFLETFGQSIKTIYNRNLQL